MTRIYPHTELILNYRRLMGGARRKSCLAAKHDNRSLSSLGATAYTPLMPGSTHHSTLDVCSKPAEPHVFLSLPVFFADF